MTTSARALVVATLLLAPAAAEAYRTTDRRWLPDQIPVQWSMTTDRDVPGIEGTRELDIVRAAFAAWEGDPGSIIAFTEVDQAQRRPIEITLEYPLPFGVISQTCSSASTDASERCGTSTSARLSRVEIKLGNQAHFISREQMRMGDCNIEAEFDGTMEFEVGLAIGLAISDRSPAVMAPPRFSCFPHRLPLQPDDVEGVRTLYCPDSALYGLTLGPIDDAVDPSCTDADGFADAGERVSIPLHVLNFSGDAQGVFVHVSSAAGSLSFVSPRIDIGLLVAGAGADVVVEAEIDSFVEPGATDELVAVVRDDAGAAQAFRFPLALQRDRVVRHLHYQDDELRPDTWTGDGWVRVTDSCTLPDAVDPWRTSRGADCHSRYGTAERDTLRSLVMLPEAPGTRPLTVTVRQWLECGDLGDSGELFVGATEPDYMQRIDRITGSFPWETRSYVITGRDYEQAVPVELRFWSTSNGTARGWAVDSIAFDWDAIELPLQLVPSCVRPCNVVADAGAPLVACRGGELLLSAAGSSVAHCEGRILYRWRRGGVVVRDESPEPEALVSDAEAGTYSVDVRCETSASCGATADIVVSVVPPPEAVGPTLRVSKSVDAIALDWVAPGDGSAVDVRRAPLDAVGSELPLVAVVTSQHSHADTESWPSGSFAFRVAAVNGCGVEEP